MLGCRSQVTAAAGQCSGHTLHSQQSTSEHFERTQTSKFFHDECRLASSEEGVVSFGVDGNQFEQFLVATETAGEAWLFVVLPPVRIESGKLRLVFTACPTDNQFDVVGLTCAYREVTRRVTSLEQDVFGPLAGHGSRGSLQKVR